MLTWTMVDFCPPFGSEFIKCNPPLLTMRNSDMSVTLKHGFSKQRQVHEKSQTSIASMRKVLVPKDFKTFRKEVYIINKKYWLG